MIRANIILDSVSSSGIRLTTYELTYPRFIHSEFMTHRVFSRNASSSRAIPVKKMLEMIRNEPAMPVHWGQNQPGMQAAEEIANPEAAKALWLEAAQQACDMAEKMLTCNLHKQVVNRITEPFAHIRVLVTATQWDNFFILRDHKDAQPEIRALAIEMKKVLSESVPTLVPEEEWHLPFIHENEKEIYKIEVLLKASTARCARVSYLNHDGSTPSIEKDINLYDQLITAKPIHASPCEHQATPNDKRWSGNFFGWDQHRKLIEQSFS
jgi:thymidylate synthase ThyX